MIWVWVLLYCWWIPMGLLLIAAGGVVGLVKRARYRSYVRNINLHRFDKLK